MSAPRYAVYKGDELLAMGTAYQIAQKMGVKVETVKWWASPASHRRADQCHEDGRSRGERKVAERID